MRHSEDRILTSHAGALHKPAGLAQLNAARELGQEYDQASYAEQLRAGVTEAVGWQVDAGVDVPNDGEVGKGLFFTYVRARLGGIRLGDESIVTKQRRRDWTLFPGYYEPILRAMGGGVDGRLVVCDEPVSYIGQEALRTDLDNLAATLDRAGVEEGFYSALAPGFLETVARNEHYRSQEEFVCALAEALREEYEAVVAAGFILQLDAPDIADAYDWMNLSVADYRRHLRSRIEILNHALRNVPPDRARVHVCWGSWPGPHVTDLPLREWVDLLLQLNVGCYSLEAATVTHELDYEVWRNGGLPDGRILMPGVVTHKTNVVEPPELVAHRLAEYAKVVGRENVIAGTDCGMMRVPDRPLARAKVVAMAEGARLASRELWAAGARVGP